MCGSRVSGPATGLIVLYFLGKRKVYPPKKAGDSFTELYLSMACQKVKTLGGFGLTNDDHTRYREKNDFLCQDRTFPDEEYPEGSDIDEGAVIPSGAGPSKPAEGESRQKQASKQLLIRMHSELVKMARQLGVEDLCAAEKATRVENVLVGISKENLECRYCRKTLSSVTHLKSHFRKLQLHITPHKCGECNTYFSESSTLRRHQAVHDQKAPKFRCTEKVPKSKKDPTLVECGKECPSNSKLLDHLDVHKKGPLIYCQFCKVKGY